MRRIIHAVTGIETTDENYSASPADMATRRSQATMPRDEFLQLSVSFGFITAAVAIEAAGGNWPTAFNAFLTGLSTAEQIQAKETWATGLDVRRDAPLLAQIAAIVPTATDAQLDVMFGIA